MESTEVVNETKVYSRSALHQYITSSTKKAAPSKSALNPYRKKPGLWSFLGLEAVNEAIATIEREENDHVTISQLRLLEAAT